MEFGLKCATNHSLMIYSEKQELASHSEAATLGFYFSSKGVTS
jgi:hypothetical protein